MTTMHTRGHLIQTLLTSIAAALSALYAVMLFRRVRRAAPPTTTAEGETEAPTLCQHARDAAGDTASVALKQVRGITARAQQTSPVQRLMATGISQRTASVVRTVQPTARGALAHVPTQEIRHAGASGARRARAGAGAVLHKAQNRLGRHSSNHPQ